MASTVSEPTPPPPLAPFVVKAPFDDGETADIVLRSSDGVDFYVLKAILAIASPVFRDMSLLPTPPPSSTESNADELVKDGLPVIIMYESTASVLDTLLRILYPGFLPLTLDIDLAMNVGRAVDKYDIGCALPWVDESLAAAIARTESSEVVIVVFLTARRIGCEVAARAAAMRFVEVSSASTYSTALEQNFSAADVARLFDFRTSVALSVRKMLSLSNPSEDVRVYEIVRDIFNCDNNCGRDPFVFRSQSWNIVKATASIKAYLAPLSTRVMSIELVTNAIKTSKCQMCREKGAEEIIDTVNAIRREMDDMAERAFKMTVLGQPAI